MNSAVCDFILFLAGCCSGAVINWAIYRLAIVHPRRTSPWSQIGSNDVRWSDFFPVVGWFFQRRLSSKWGRNFWIRPMLIEASCGVALPLLSRGIHSGMLTAGANFNVLPPTASQQVIWTTFYFLLIALLIAATFIDFDEKTIPDEITLVGTLIALLCAYFVPGSRLPNVDVLPAGPQINQLHYGSPGELPVWHQGHWGLVAVIALSLIWMFALVPKTITWRYGLARGTRYLWASIWRANRRQHVHVNPKPISIVNPWSLSVLWLLLIGSSAVAWLTGGSAWDYLFSAWMGLAFGGGLVWAVRIIAGGALGKEAMGFGDVTLMGMIGAWLGWQPALLIFAIAPFAALLIAVVQLLTIRHTEIAFGPYLSLGTVIVLTSWGSIWHDWAKFGVFSLGPALLVIIAICLILMAGMLGGWRAIQNRWSEDNS